MCMGQRRFRSPNGKPGARAGLSRPSARWPGVQGSRGGPCRCERQDTRVSRARAGAFFRHGALSAASRNAASRMSLIVTAIGRVVSPLARARELVVDASETRTSLRHATVSERGSSSHGWRPRRGSVSVNPVDLDLFAADPAAGVEQFQEGRALDRAGAVERATRTLCDQFEDPLREIARIDELDPRGSRGCRGQAPGRRRQPGPAAKRPVGSSGSDESGGTRIERAPKISVRRSVRIRPSSVREIRTGDWLIVDASNQREQVSRGSAVWGVTRTLQTLETRLRVAALAAVEARCGELRRPCGR